MVEPLMVAAVRTRALEEAADYIAGGILGDGAPDYSYTDLISDRTLRGVVNTLRELAVSATTSVVDAAAPAWSPSWMCGCGCPLVACPGCAEPRCLHCDPACDGPAC